MLPFDESIDLQRGSKLLPPQRQRPTHHHSSIFKNIHAYGKYKMRSRYDQTPAEEEEPLEQESEEGPSQ